MKHQRFLTLLATVALLLSSVSHSVTHDIIESASDPTECHYCINETTSVEVTTEAQPIFQGRCLFLNPTTNGPIGSTPSGFSARAPPAV
ncbi:MAG: hypothetical protein CNF01_04125 [Halieaceae bacterium MED-G27]|nr:MAG: hypothetical protein CBB81_08280 [Cellvibrionales bacterium TMED21]PDH37521.1 MAG: hypothetical protein CNF01_04125 [Halieaceae bacterium MED-G27]